MQRDETPRPEQRREPEPTPGEETAEHPAPGVEHEPEPDAENLIPVKDRPGTF